jgi:neutral ceramidase
MNAMPFVRILLALVVVLSGLQLAPGAEFKAGIAVVDVTPPSGYRMSGYFYERLNTGIHDPLQAKALVLEQGSERAALVFCDLISVSLELSSKARRLASRRSGIPVENILIAGTHTHTGPLYTGALRDYLHEAAKARDGRDLAEGVDYPSILAERIADAIAQAKRSVQPVKPEAGKGEAMGLAFNRRFHMKDGSVVFNPGKQNPNIIKPAGPVDTDLGILLFLNPERTRVHASFVSFALHLDTVGGTEYSADYPFYLEQQLKQVLGSDLVSLFGTGTCGDINHIDVSHKLPQKGHAEAQRIGRELSQAIVLALPDLLPIEEPALAVRSARISAPLQKVTPEQVEEARSKLSRVGTPQLGFLAGVEAFKVVDIQRRGGVSIPLEVQVFRIGPNTAIVGLPGEVFVELGMAIKKQSPFPNTFVVELCNDSIGYVPTEKAFREGSYEVVNSRVQPGTGERLVETAVRLLKELQTE